MANMTIKNIPDELYEKLKKQAAENRRSINNEVIVCLEKELKASRIDPEEFLASIREFRSKLPKELELITDEDINAAKNEGRP